MKINGFTFVELLIVISISAIMAVVSFSRFAALKEDQTLKAATNQLQSLVRTAQTNATTGVKCSSIQTDPSGTWAVGFRTDGKNIDLMCYVTDPAALVLKKTLTFESIQPNIDSISGKNGLTNCPSSFPGSLIRVSFAPLTGAVTFTDTNPAASSCLEVSSELTVRFINGSNIKSLVISKGGSIEIK